MGTHEVMLVCVTRHFLPAEPHSFPYPSASLPLTPRRSRTLNRAAHGAGEVRTVCLQRRMMNVSEALGSEKLRPSQQLSNPGLVQAGRHPSHSTASVQEGQIYRQSTPGKLLEGQRKPPASTEDPLV